MAGSSRRMIRGADGSARTRSIRFAQLTALALVVGLSLAAAETPNATPKAATDNPDAPSSTPGASPAKKEVKHSKPRPSNAGSPPPAGFGPMMPGLHATASPSPTARPRRSKKTAAAPTPAATPSLASNKSGSSASAKATPATAPTVKVAQPGSTPHAKTASASHQSAPHTGSTAVPELQPPLTTGQASGPVSAQPPPPAEGPLNAQASQHSATTTTAKPPPVAQPSPVVATTPPPKNASRAATGASPPSSVQQSGAATGQAVPAVWVNSETHVYHRAGSRYYGKTKKGQYMSEQEAISQGNRPAREWTAPAP
jgi:hypothetical protein